jgi:WD40 repeat protein
MKLKKKCIILYVISGLVLICIVIPLIRSLLMRPQISPDWIWHEDQDQIFQITRDEIKNLQMGVIYPELAVLEMFEVKVPGGIFYRFPIKHYLSSYENIQVDPDYQTIFLSLYAFSHTGFGLPVLVTSSGEVLHCPERITPAGRYVGQISEDTILFNAYPDKDNNNDQIIELNMRKCEVEKVVYSPEDGNEIRDAFYLKNFGLLINEDITTYDKNLTVLDPNYELVGKFPSTTASAWSPNGEWISIWKWDRRDNLGFYIVDKFGENEIQLTRKWAAIPLWSPVENKIAFGLSKSDPHPVLFLYDVEEQNLEVIVDELVKEYDWHPEGTFIAYSNWRDSGIGIYSLETQQSRRIGKGVFRNFAWSPDGSSIIGNTEDGMILLNVETGEMIPIGGKSRAKPIWISN